MPSAQLPKSKKGFQKKTRSKESYYFSEKTSTAISKTIAQIPNSAILLLIWFSMHSLKLIRARIFLKQLSMQFGALSWSLELTSCAWALSLKLSIGLDPWALVLRIRFQFGIPLALFAFRRGCFFFCSFCTKKRLSTQNLVWKRFLI